jgi:hypothetical protein
MGIDPRRARAAPAFLAALALLAACSASVPEDGAKAARPLAEVYAALGSIAAAHPGIASAATIGLGASLAHPEGDPKLPLMALEIRAGSSSSPGAPAALLVGAMHGNEEVGAELALAVAEKLCASVGDGSAADKLASSTALTIIPVANPWGYESGLRENSRGVDLNRNFDWAWAYGGASSEKGVSALSEIESRALVADARAKRYALAVSLHAGSFCISLPWDYLKTSSAGYSAFSGGAWPFGIFGSSEYRSLYSPANALFEAKGAAYASLVGAVSGTTAGSFATTQGGDWYVVCGSFADWLYGILGCPCYTIELSPNQYWAARDHAMGIEVVQAHETALLGLLASAGMGARGRVVDAFGAARADAAVTAIPVASSRDVAPAKEYEAFSLSDPEGYYFISLPSGSAWKVGASYGGVASAAQDAIVGADGYSPFTTLSIP